ncbi:K(+)-transporting ATPase subunit B (plasmid) [Streptomyces clavuligerus]|uniref:Potassium-transporting ATPase ATP-binding subunit n=6 Tax=Streptomyces clavuligerus TaxID=1901 RepID=D5SLL5_STRCL|nr:potassium-transporting ATPase subunit KdpB [Streptomyces clavuligerus]EFG04808.1 Potassium-transporting ATPase subunit B [Streptomyces clavuligerus]MBY6306746.1 potassium-transporting ATPase subunit KdpB [Streptomyces clavuligerus]QCS10649.1 K(+)-transporting ATPase subunit B [Streptomyces clavuligerus]QPJ97314.1 potassium-transporting ATPase subunit KdpB [Streptomyces clavuligerus]WDN57361.1 potassium-transporting ATPase subunit KdpB [Streptomyces clavuligerus]
MHPSASPQAPPTADGFLPQPPPPPTGPLRPARRRHTAPRRGLLDAAQIRRALPEALHKLDPRTLVRNPVLFVVAVGSLLTTVSAVFHPTVFTWLITVWLWLTVLFANLAESVAESRGRAHAASLRRSRADITARRLRHWRYGINPRRAEADTVPAAELRLLDFVLVESGEVVPADGEVVDGVAAVDESAITGESAPVIREAGGDRSGVTGGTTVLSDGIVVRITARPGHSFLDRMISLVEGARRQKTPNEVALNILLAALTLGFVLVVLTLQPMAAYAGAAQSTTVVVALLVTLIPTTIGALLSAIGIAGMDRLVQRNVVALSGRAVEAAGDVDTLLLDKTGTITHGNRLAVGFVPLPGVPATALADAAQLSSLADRTPEGRSVLALAERQFGLRPPTPEELPNPHFIDFSARTRMSGVELRWENGGGCAIRKGAAAEVVEWVTLRGGTVPRQARDWADGIAVSGGTPLLVALHDEDGPRVLGLVHLKDVVKDGMRERFEELRRMGIRTVMITGDNPLTARAIAREAGVDDFLAEATPEDKMALIKREQAGGKLVAMTGDGTNDAPALAQADVGVAMNTGTSAAKEAGNMVDLDSDPTKLIEIVEIGKQLLITRGALTTFSITNDVAKYFAIIPAMFTGAYPQLEAVNIMGLHSPTTAIASAIIFNALIIVALIPLALRGVRYTPASAHDLLRRNLALYGIGGLVLPFLGIKLIDLALSVLPGLG